MDIAHRRRLLHLPRKTRQRQLNRVLRKQPMRTGRPRHRHPSDQMLPNWLILKATSYPVAARMRIRTSRPRRQVPRTQLRAGPREAYRPPLAAVAHRRQRVYVRARQGHRRRRRRQLRRVLAPPPAAHQDPRPVRARAKAPASQPASQPASRVKAKVRRLPRAPSANCRRSRWPRRRMRFRSRRPSRPPRRAPGQARRRPQVGRRQAPAAEVLRPWHRPRQVPRRLPPALRPAPRRPLLWARRRRRRLPRRSLNPAQVPVLRAVRASRRCRPTSSRTPLRRRPSR